jgi:hypothetical protein
MKGGLGHEFREKEITLAIALASAFALAVGVTPAFAVHDLQFELDGNTEQDNTSTPLYDWYPNIYTLPVPPGASIPTIAPSLPANFGPAAPWVRDFVPGSTADATTFATGSKDTQNPSGGNSTVNGSWQCATANNLSDKVDVNNAYAVAYIDHTRDVGFWFLKDKNVGALPGKGQRISPGAIRTATC